jgi:hypothetical protein
MFTNGLTVGEFEKKYHINGWIIYGLSYFLLINKNIFFVWRNCTIN